MDGVLVFSEDAWFAVYNETLVHFGHEPIPREDFDTIFGNGTQADRDTYMPERSVAEVDAAYRAFFERHLGLIRPNREAVPVLVALRRRGVRTALATNTSRPLAERILGSLGLLQELDVLACADEAGTGKPDPAVLRLAALRLGVPLREAVFVGDSRYDEAAAAAAAVRFVGYRYGEGARIEALEALFSDVLFESAAGPGGPAKP